MLQAIAARVGAEIPHDPDLQVLSEDTAPEKLVQQIESREGE